MTKRAHNAVDYSGIKVNKLEILEFVKTKNNRSIWLCKCDCGTFKELPAYRVKNGIIKSCGCIRNDKKPKSFTNRMYSIYKRSAKKRKHDFLLDIGDFKTLVKGDCYYCGFSPSKLSYSYLVSNYSEDINGIDRLDSSFGYSVDNCVSCCKSCNRMKMDMRHDDFIEHIKKISERFQ